MSSRSYRTPVLIQVELRCIRECIHAVALLIYAYVPFASIQTLQCGRRGGCTAYMAVKQCICHPFGGPSETTLRGSDQWVVWKTPAVSSQCA